MFKNSDAIDKDLDYFFDLERDVQGKMLGFIEQNRKKLAPGVELEYWEPAQSGDWFIKVSDKGYLFEGGALSATSQMEEKLKIKPVANTRIFKVYEDSRCLEPLGFSIAFTLYKEMKGYLKTNKIK